MTRRGDIDDFSADYYDRSIEAFLGSRPAELPSLSPLAEQGFRLLWVHSVAEGCVMPRGKCRCQAVGLKRHDGE